jgi:hypothetical protein
MGEHEAHRGIHGREARVRGPVEGLRRQRIHGTRQETSRGSAGGCDQFVRTEMVEHDDTFPVEPEPYSSHSARNE